MATLASVPVDILILIFTYLECFADLTSVAGVCKYWRNAVHLRLCASQQEPRYRARQLPWLLQSSEDSPPSTITSYISGTTGRRICLPVGVRRRDRFCGSHEGGWVAVAAGRRRPYCELVNLINQAIARIPLPDTLRRSQPTYSVMVEIRMVTLSDVPTEKSCIAAAHTVGRYPSIIFCRPHVDGHWVPPLQDTEQLQDTLYHRGQVFQGFYSISSRDNLYLFLPREINKGETLHMEQLVIPFALPVMDGCTVMRYLVESRGKLLLVLRYSGRATGLDRRTLHFRVFQMEVTPMPDDEGHELAWVELHGLDGRVITLAKGCSRAFEARQYKGFQGGSIYFLDDAVSAGRMNPIFSFADFGMYSMGETKIERPGLPNPASRGFLDGDGAWDGRTEYRRMLAGCEPASNTMYGPRELMVRNAAGPVTSRPQIVREIATDDEANSSTSAGGGEHAAVHETVASVWPLLCKPGNRGPIWFMPPSADEWLLPPPPPPPSSRCAPSVGDV